MKDSSPDWILASVTAAAGFLATYVFASFALPVSLVISALAFASGSLLFRKKNALIEPPPPDLEASLAEGRRKLNQIRALGRNIKNERLERVCKTIEKILAEIRRDPADLKRARQFLSYYLDSTINILEKYEKLSAQDIGDPAIRASLSRVESMIDTINLAFEKQLSHLLSNDVMDLDTELSLLEKTIQMEGLGE